MCVCVCVCVCVVCLIQIHVNFSHINNYCLRINTTLNRLFINVRK